MKMIGTLIISGILTLSLCFNAYLLGKLSIANKQLAPKINYERMNMVIKESLAQ
jgi:hypothetical protein